MLTIAHDDGQCTAIGRVVAAYDAAAVDEEDLFASRMWADVDGPADRMGGAAR